MLFAAPIAQRLRYMTAYCDHAWQLMGSSAVFVLGLVLCACAGLAPAPAAAADSPESAAVACAGLTPGPARTVVRIIDGETVGLDDGSEVRLIGALAPRALDVGAAPGAWPWETQDARRPCKRWLSASRSSWGLMASAWIATGACRLTST